MNNDQAAFDHKMALLDKEKEKKLSNAKLTEHQRAKIEADYEKKTAKLKQEQFKKQKAADIVQALINTALAVTRALPNPIAAAAAGIAGAAQVAVIAAQKVPEFDQGIESSPKDFIAGERRPEWMITPSGNVQLVTRPTLFKNMAGATVISGDRTEKLLQAGVLPTSGDYRPVIDKLDSLERTIKNKRELNINARSGRISDREGNYYRDYLNKYFTWAGR